MTTLVTENVPLGELRLEAFATLTEIRALEAANSSVDGLSDEEAGARLESVGPNQLSESSKVGALELLLSQFKSALVVLLLASAVVAGLVGHVTDAAAISIVVLLNAVLGFGQEWRADRALQALRSMLPQRARTRRQGTVRSLPCDTLVPGDVVLLESGDRVPADGRLLSARELLVDQSALTGESVPVPKSEASLEAPPVHLHESANIVLSNTQVVSGRGTLLVVATGARSRVGGIAHMVAEQSRRPTPLQEQLDRVGKQLALATVVIIAGILSWSYFFSHQPWVDQLLTAVSLAAAGIPEGLPAVLTVTLALGMRRMAKQNAIVRRLNSVETLGATDVICTDKTGTLTENRLAVQRLAWPGQAASESDGVPERAARIAVLCSHAASPDDTGADPVEQALQALADDKDREELRAHWTEVGEVPFSSVRSYMATFHRSPQGDLVCAKGSPSVILERCDLWASPAGDRPMDPQVLDEVARLNQEMSADGMRVLALADRKGAHPATEDSVRSMTFVALVGMLDGAREGVAAALASCRSAGIRVVMLTGDQPGTAGAIGRHLGFSGSIQTGDTLFRGLTTRLSAEDLEGVEIVARVQPEHKYQIVAALQSRRHVVAVTGDGVNDAPALKVADIGIAMGRGGTEVARQASDMVLADDNFVTIVEAVRQGRSIYANLVKFVRFQVSTNVGALATVLGATLLGWESPLSPLQILWINVIMDGPPAMALGVDPPHPAIMDAPPRPRGERILNSRTVFIIIALGVLMAVGTLLLFGYALGQYVRWASTMAFTTFVLYQVCNILNIRSERTFFARETFRNGMLWVALAAVVAIHVAIIYVPPLHGVFRVVALEPVHWALCVAVAGSALVVSEVARILVRGWLAVARKGSDACGT